MSGNEPVDSKPTFKLNLTNKMLSFNTMVQETLRITKNKSELRRGKSQNHFKPF